MSHWAQAQTSQLSPLLSLILKYGQFITFSTTVETLTYENTLIAWWCLWCIVSKSSLYHRKQFTLFLFLVLQTIPATNRLSLPEVTKQMLRRTSRKQVRSWLCCWPAYRHFSLYSASLCPGGHLHLAWPESARGCRERGGIWVECVCLIGHHSRLLKEPSIFFRNLFKWSFSVCEWKKLMLEAGETVPPLKPSTKMPNPVFWHLVILIFPWLFCDIPLHHVYVIAALMFTHKHKHIQHIHMLRESNTEMPLH